MDIMFYASDNNKKETTFKELGWDVTNPPKKVNVEFFHDKDFCTLLQDRSVNSNDGSVVYFGFCRGKQVTLTVKNV